MKEARTDSDRLIDRNGVLDNRIQLDGREASKLPFVDEPSTEPRRRSGRPRSGEGPIIPWQEIDKLLVFGEVVRDPKNGREALRFPSIAILAKRYGCSRTLIWRFATRSRCYARREEAKAKTQETYERKVIEKLANTQAAAAVDVTTIVDDFITKFRQALREGRVRADSPADLDRLVRLKELLSGNADTRNELQGQLSLEAIQSRHRRLRDQVDGMTAELAGTQAGTADVPGVQGDAGGELELAGTTVQVAGELDATGPIGGAEGAE